MLNADQTGWRVNGKSHWPWCFASKGACYYQIDRSRGGPALEKFFLDAFDGVLVHDFWAAYDPVLAGVASSIATAQARAMEDQVEHLVQVITDQIVARSKG